MELLVLKKDTSGSHKTIRDAGHEPPAFTLIELLVVIAIIPLCRETFSQGSLTPPGPPGPTMKTLAEIEPRTGISAIPFTILEPGSYYLTQNLAGVSEQHGVIVQADSVTIDLNGFSLAGAPGALHGIFASGARRNRITGGAGSIVTSCFASANTGSGIAADDVCQITGCNTAFNSQSGIVAGNDCSVNQCTASNNQGTGITSGPDSQISDSKVLSNRLAGIRSNLRTTIRACTAQRNLADGIVVSGECTVAGNSSNNNFNARDAAGIRVTGTDNIVRENNVISNDRGLSVEVGGNMILKNTAANNTINYFVSGVQTMGPIFKGPGPVDDANPWINFEF